MLCCFGFVIILEASFLYEIEFCKKIYFLKYTVASGYVNMNEKKNKLQIHKKNDLKYLYKKSSTIFLKDK